LLELKVQILTFKAIQHLWHTYLFGQQSSQLVLLAGLQQCPSVKSILVFPAASIPSDVRTQSLRACRLQAVPFRNQKLNAKAGQTMSE